MSLFQNTCKPVGLGGKFMVSMMNKGHAPMAGWGFSHIQVKKNSVCLDIGCGGGANVKQLLRKAPEGKVTGIDYSEVSVETSKNKNKSEISNGRCSIIKANVMDLPFDEEIFDLATAFETIYFWPDITKAFEQIYRVLKKDGVFMICNEANGKNPKDEKWTKKIDGMVIYEGAKLKSCLEKAGFKDIKVDENDKCWLCVRAIK